MSEEKQKANKLVKDKEAELGVAMKHLAKVKQSRGDISTAKATVSTVKKELYAAITAENQVTLNETDAFDESELYVEKPTENVGVIKLIVVCAVIFTGAVVWINL